MKITRRQLKRLIREAASLHPDVSGTIEKFSTQHGQRQWARVENEFYVMAEGDSNDGVRDEYYSGWTNEDFIAVIQGVTGEYSP